MNVIKNIQQNFKQIQQYSTKKLVNKLLFSQFICLFLIALVGYLINYTSINNSVSSNALIMLAFFISIIMVALFFIMGLIIFIRRENPYTITYEFFRWKIFSHGLIPQLLGLFIMSISCYTLFLIFSVLLQTAR